MIPTLRQIAAEVHRIVDGGVSNTDSQLDTRYTINFLREELNELLSVSWIPRRQAVDDRTAEKMYIASFPKIDVAFDQDTERSYADLPSYYVSLPWNRGVYQVSSMDTPLEPMIEKLNPGVSVTLPAGKLQGKIGYYTEGLRIFWDEDVRRKGIKKVMVKLLVAAPDIFGEDDPLPVSPEQVKTIRNNVINLYKSEGIQDKIADANKDIGVKIGD